MVKGGIHGSSGADSGKVCLFSKKDMMWAQYMLSNVKYTHDAGSPFLAAPGSIRRFFGPVYYYYSEDLS